MSIVILYYIPIENNPHLSHRILLMSFFWSFFRKNLLFFAAFVAILAV